jgi:uncharacterized glyoxalase superfamily protein PhnB
MQSTCQSVERRRTPKLYDSRWQWDGVVEWRRVQTAEMSREASMLVNRSSPTPTVIPVLGYEDVVKASDWLCDAFGFSVRLRIGNHRAQLVFGDGAVIVTERHLGHESDAPDRAESRPPHPDELSHAVHVRIADVDQHYERASQRGARILRQPADYPYGERQYTAEDLGGHRWTFSQSIADVAPEEWGGTPAETR